MTAAALPASTTCGDSCTDTERVVRQGLKEIIVDELLAHEEVVVI